MIRCAICNHEADTIRIISKAGDVDTITPGFRKAKDSKGRECHICDECFNRAVKVERNRR